MKTPSILTTFSPYDIPSNMTINANASPFIFPLSSIKFSKQPPIHAMKPQFFVNGVIESNVLHFVGRMRSERNLLPRVCEESITMS